MNIDKFEYYFDYINTFNTYTIKLLRWQSVKEYKTLNTIYMNSSSKDIRRLGYILLPIILTNKADQMHGPYIIQH